MRLTVVNISDIVTGPLEADPECLPGVNVHHFGDIITFN